MIIHINVHSTRERISKGTNRLHVRKTLTLNYLSKTHNFLSFLVIIIPHINKDFSIPVIGSTNQKIILPIII
uniref:Uncharacterized protein n=1 Tax=Lepeophtheirus salmonis TaxID=72036 RepID=A0A0K2SZQ2_LEPSM